MDHLNYNSGKENIIASGIHKIRFGNPDKFTPDFFRKEDIKYEFLKKLPEPEGLPFEIKNIKCKVKSNRIIIFMPTCNEKEKFYGFGLDPNAFQQNDLRKWLCVSSENVSQTGASHGPVPFYLSTEGYGVYVDTARVPFVHIGTLNLKGKQKNGNNHKNFVANHSDIKTSTEQLYAKVKTKGEKEIVFDIPGAKGIDIYIFEGPSIKEVIQRYNLFSGGGCIPPLWGLGLKYRVYSRAKSEEVLNIAKSLREFNIPCDMLGLEPGWQTEAYSSSFVWSEKNFPDHEKFTETLNRMGFKINLWEHAYIHPSSPVFDTLEEKSGDYLVWNGLVVDFADPEASEKFAEYHNKQLMSTGITGFKLDECDRQFLTDCTPFNFPYCSSFPSGIDGEQMSQLYGYLYQQSIYSVFESNNLRTWSDVRATSALAAPLPFNLYSDTYGFDEYLRQLVNSSFAGLLWSPEIRKADTYEELLNRVAMSALAPQMCLNIWFMPHPIWKQYEPDKNKAGDLLSEDEQKEVASKLREITNLRMSLLPYFYSSFYRYYREGIPPVRALIMEFPQDDKLRDVDDQYMFGNNILVAPLKETSSSRTVYLPRGIKWIEYETGRMYSGGGKYQFNYQPGSIPLFVKENSLIPLAKPILYVTDNTIFDITVKVYGDKPKSYNLYEDDGVSFNFKRGEYTTLKLFWDKDEGENSERSGNYKKIRYRINKWEKVY